MSETTVIWSLIIMSILLVLIQIFLPPMYIGLSKVKRFAKKTLSTTAFSVGTVFRALTNDDDDDGTEFAFGLPESTARRIILKTLRDPEVIARRRKSFMEIGTLSGFLSDGPEIIKFLLPDDVWSSLGEELKLDQFQVWGVYIYAPVEKES